MLVLSIFCGVLSAVMIPPRKDYGSVWNAYLAEKDDSLDVLYFGSSLSYCDIVPAVVWQKSGYASFVMAGPEQTPAMTYYYLRETLKTQTPQAVFIEITGVFFSRYTNFTKVNVGYMPWGLNRLAATFRASEPSQRLGLMFPLYNYHDRWADLPNMDWTVLWENTPDNMAGYTFLSDIAKLDGIRTRPVEFDQVTYDDNIGWLHKIADYCTKKGVKTVFYISPSYYRLEESYLTMLESDLPDNAVFRDFNAEFDSIGLDPTADFYDYMHFNWRGAEKFSAALANWMNALNLTSSPADSTLWQDRLTAFEEKKEVQP